MSWRNFRLVQPCGVATAGAAEVTWGACMVFIVSATIAYATLMENLDDAPWHPGTMAGARTRNCGKARCRCRPGRGPARADCGAHRSAADAGAAAWRAALRHHRAHAGF